MSPYKYFINHMRTHLRVEGMTDGQYYICWPDGEKFAGPYFRAQDAKGQLTRYLNDKS